MEFHEDVVCHTDWKCILQKWNSATTYEELKGMVRKEDNSPLRSGVHHEMSGSDTVDWVAMNFFPNDGPGHIWRWKLFSKDPLQKHLWV